MKKKSVIWGSVGIIIIITILIIVNPFKKDVWDINAENFKYSFQPISGDSVIDDLSEWTPFEWDTLYSFKPYTTKEKIYETVGYKWNDISETVSEGMNQIVFIKNGKVVCYLYGYPKDNKLGFNFGKYEGSYIKLTSEQKLSFKTTISGENGVRYFDYIK
jgi:hypothetical protein